MNFSDWMEVYNKSPRGSEAEREALDKMMYLAKTFDEWKNVFYRMPIVYVQKRMALLQMATWAKTFGQWLNVYEESPEGDAVEETALVQLIKFADDPKDANWTKDKEGLKLQRWMKILDITPESSEAEILAIQKVVEELKKRKEKKEISGDFLKI